MNRVGPLSTGGARNSTSRSLLRPRARRARVCIAAAAQRGLGITLAIAAILSPVTAFAACQTWHLLRKFNAVQENGYTVVFELAPPAGDSASGRAYYYTGSDFRRVNGNVVGTFDRRGALTLEVSWQNDSLGRYDGHIDSEGNLAGLTRDLTRGGSREVRWRSKQKFTCALEEAPKKVKTLGKRRS